MSRTSEYMTLYVSEDSYREASDLPRVNHGLRYNKDETLDEFTAKEAARTEQCRLFTENVKLEAMEGVDREGRDVPYIYKKFCDDMLEDGFEFKYGGEFIAASKNTNVY